MKTQPDYSLYYLHELEAALANVDESINPNEAMVIRGYIESGGYTNPESPEVICVRFTSATYKRTLLAVLSVLFLTNLYLLVVDNRLLALLPLTFQGVLLFMIHKEHKHALGLIKIWAALLVTSGLFGLLSMFYAPEINWLELTRNFFWLGCGVIFFALSNKFIEIVLVKE